ncbi:serine/threonine-protein kinase [Streptomyces sp. TE33382]
MVERVLAGRYRMERCVGRGGMGEVWEAFDERLGRKVAVKVVSLLAGGGTAAGELRVRFLREARITAALEHPRIVAVHDLGEAATPDGQAPYLVMEFLRGEGLEAVARRGPVAREQVARWGAQICDALTEAHAGGILHRDIKPANIFITASGGVKVLDFGIARAADPSATGDLLTRTGMVVGTAAYMAPEQARGRPERRSDLYAVGCLLFELLTGRLPFSSPDALGFLTAHLHDVPPAPGSVLPGIPAAWDRLVLRLLEKDPERRYGSAGELGAELRALRGGTDRGAPVPAQRTPTVVDTGGARPQPSPYAPTADVSPPAGSRPRTRRDALRLGAAVAVLGAAGTGAALYLTDDPDKGPLVWSRGIGDSQKLDGSDSAMAVGGGRWFVAAGLGPVVVHAFDAARGTRLWKATVNGDYDYGDGSPRLAVVGGAVVVRTRPADGDGPRFDALDVDSGKLLWRREPESGSWAVHRPSGLLLVHSDTAVSGLDPRTGEERWQYTSDIPGSALPAGDLVLFGDAALLGRTGKAVWRQAGFSPKGDLAHAPGKLLLCYENGRPAATDLVCRSARTGEVLWRTPFNDREEQTGTSRAAWEALVSGTTVFLPLAAGGRKEPTAVDVASGRVKWTYGGPYERALEFDDGNEPKRVRGIRNVLAVAGGFVLPTGERTVCLGTDDGKERWHSTKGRIDGTDTYVLISETHKRLFTTWRRAHVLHAADGREVWAGEFANAFANEPAFTKGRGFVAEASGTLWALRL